jgi:hypothetical protein
VAHRREASITAMGIKLVNVVVAPTLTVAAAVGTVATVAPATALVGHTAAITGLVMAMAESKETPWS